MFLKDARETIYIGNRRSNNSSKYFVGTCRRISKTIYIHNLRSSDTASRARVAAPDTCLTQIRIQTILDTFLKCPTKKIETYWTRIQHIISNNGHNLTQYFLEYFKKKQGYLPFIFHFPTIKTTPLVFLVCLSSLFIFILATHRCFCLHKVFSPSLFVFHLLL